MPRPLSEWQDEIAAEMLSDLAQISGVSVGEMLVDDLNEHLPELPEPPESDEGDYEVFPVYDEPTESEDLDLDSDYGDTGDYFDEFFDDLDIDSDQEDSYGDD